MKKLLLVLFALFISTGMAFADEKTIQTNATSGTWTGDANAYTATIDGFKISYEKNNSTSDLVAPSNDHIRVYKNAKLVVSGANGETITSVVLNVTTKKYAVDMTVSDGTNATADATALTVTWTGNTKSFEAVASEGQVRVKSIVVTYTSEGGVTKKDANLKFSTETINIEQGVDQFTAPTFSKETTAPVTFASDNEEVAKVDANGVITLAGATGKAVITAKAEANDEFNAGEAKCTVSVFTYNVYKKATAIESGKKYLIVAQRDGNTYYAYPLKEDKKYGYLSTGKVEGTVDEVKVKNYYDDAFTFETYSEGYSIKDNLNRYYVQKEEFKSFNTQEEPAAWTVEPQADGTFKIAMNGYYMQFGEGTYTSIGVYTDAQENAVLPYLYEYYDAQSGVKDVTVNKAAENAPVYNLAGQRVSKDTKGILIQNGKKFINK